MTVPEELRDDVVGGGQVYPSGSSLEVLRDGDSAYPAMLSAISSAVQEVYLAVYHFDDDPVGRLFLGELLAARSRGVDVRVILDSIGAVISRPSIGPKLVANNIATKSFAPAWQVWRLNRRFHRKILVVDGKTAFFGGMNIRHCHLVEESPGQAYRDFAFKVQGSLVNDLHTLFLEDWGSANWKHRRLAPVEGTVRAVEVAEARILVPATSEELGSLEQQICNRIHDATERIWASTAYLFPTDSIVKALAAAAKKGVEVHLISDRMEGPIFSLPAAVSISELISLGCQIYLCTQGYEHSKLWIFDDDCVLLGSANLDPRSLFLNEELVIEVKGNRGLVRLLHGELADRAADYGSVTSYPAGGLTKALAGTRSGRCLARLLVSVL